MKYLQAIRPFELINSIVDNNLRSKRKEESASKNKENLEKSTLSESQITDKLITYQESQQFMLELRRSATEQSKRENAIKRKINIFEKIQIEPHYLEETERKKIVEFQFHLGSDWFLERTETLYEQVMEITKAVKQILENRGEALQDYFKELEGSCRRVAELIEQIGAARLMLRKMRERKEFTIGKLLKKKRVIKDKLQLLKNVKNKNEAAFLDITNIDQAFVTQQSRVKLYKKLTKLTELEKSKYVMTIKNKLIGTSKNNKKLIEEGLEEWTSYKLNEKQVQKLAFMIYFMEKQEIYHENHIKIDYNKVNKDILKLQILKIFEWKSFHYIKDLATRERIYQFLNYLIKRIE